MTTCKNCSNSFNGKYCNICGEKVYTEHDKSVLHFVEEGLHFITHFEGTLFITIKTFFSSPGKLSVDYCNGIRKKYFKPIPLFLLLIVLYLLFPFFDGLNMKMEYYAKQSLYGNYAQQKIEEAKTKTGLSTELLSEKFHVKAEKSSKFLLISLIPFTALVFYGMSFLKRKFFFDSMVYSAEINSFYLIWGFFTLPLLMTIFLFLSNKVFGSHLVFSETWVGLLIYLPTCIYVAISSRKFYDFKVWQSLLFTIAFLFSHVVIVYSLYKFILFFTVIHLVH